jgi:hypothetical protein
MDRFGQMDEYDDEQRESQYNLIIKAIEVFEKKLPITEDFMSDCHDLVVSYYSNFINVPVYRAPIVQDFEYIRLMAETNAMAVNMVKPPIYIAEFYQFCKHIVLMLKRLDDLDAEKALLEQMANLSIKTNRRKLRK